MFTYHFDGLLRRVFSLLQVDGIYLCVSLWLEGTKFLFLSKIFSASLTLSLARGSPPSVHDDPCSKLFFARSLAWDPFTTTSVPKLIFLFPISADGRRRLLPLCDSSQSFGFYLLPSPVRRFVRAIICPCTPFFTHLVIEYKYLLVSILTWICYLRNWPRFLFQRSVLGLLIQIQRNSSNPLFLFSQRKTTWQKVQVFITFVAFLYLNSTTG